MSGGISIVLYPIVVFCFIIISFLNCMNAWEGFQIKGRNFTLSLMLNLFCFFNFQFIRNFLNFLPLLISFTYFMASLLSYFIYELLNSLITPLINPLKSNILFFQAMKISLKSALNAVLIYIYVQGK